MWRRFTDLSVIVILILSLYKENKMGLECSAYKRENSYEVFVGKPGVKRPLGRHRRRWEVYVKMVLTEVGLEDVDWILLVQCRGHW